MVTFFNSHYLEHYLSQKAGQLASAFDIGKCNQKNILFFFLNISSKEGKLKEILDSPVVESIIETKLEEVAERPEGMWLAMVGVESKQLKPLIRPFILSMASDVAPMVLFFSHFYSKFY